MAKLDSERKHPDVEIVIRGPVKSGKTTLAALLYKFLREKEINVAWEDPDLTAKQMQERQAYTGENKWLPQGKVTISSEQLSRGS